MSPYEYVREATNNGESLLSLCCGIGLELKHIKTRDVTAVDIFQGYLDEVPNRCPQAQTVCSDTLAFLKNAPDKSYDVVSLIDGLEHMDKPTGVKVLKEMKRVARKKILLFTPNGFVKNEPVDTWGVKGGDEYQKHLSGWTTEELKEYKFEVLYTQGATSTWGDKYTEAMYAYNV